MGDDSEGDLDGDGEKGVVPRYILKVKYWDLLTVGFLSIRETEEPRKSARCFGLTN